MCNLVLIVQSHFKIFNQWGESFRMHMLMFLNFPHLVSWICVRGAQGVNPGHPGGRPVAERGTPPSHSSLLYLTHSAAFSVGHFRTWVRGMSICAAQDTQPQIRTLTVGPEALPQKDRMVTVCTELANNLSVCSFLSLSPQKLPNHPCVAGLLSLAPCQVAHLSKCGL